MNEYKKVIAVDFDGCLCESKWPEIGEPRLDVIERAKHERENGAELVLWTCREGELLENALAFCKAHGLEFDAVNCNTPRMVELYGSDCRKVSAAEYWDDHAVKVPEEGGWISVKDRLPELIPCNAGNLTSYSEAVVVLTSGRKIITAVYSDDYGWIGDFEFWEADDEVITHWKSILPLPTPSKEV